MIRFLCFLFLPLALFSYEDMRYEIRNLQEEIEILKEHVINQEITIEALVEKISALSDKNQPLELQLLKKAREETAKKITGLESTLAKEQENRKNLQEAVQTLLEAINGKKDSNKNVTTYKVQSGDSLEKIAKKHKTTIQALKELNGLSKDSIIIGQKLKVPG